MNRYPRKETSMLKGLWIVALAMAVMACQPKHTENKSTGHDNDRISQKVIYGEDDRINLYDINDLVWKAYASSTVALIDSYKISEKDGGYHISGSIIGEDRNFCADEPFYNEPYSAYCSGSLIGKDLIATAGHCVRNQTDCDGTNFVFNFAYKNSSNDDPQTVGKDDVYGCKEIVHSEVQGFRGSDFAIIRLDREVVGHTPLKVREKGIVGDNADLVVIGHPSGLPTKYADGANVRSNLEADYFVANLDTYGGNSGSAVFDKNTGLVEGILVRGERDYVYDNGCLRSNKCEDDGCRGEDVTRITKIFDHINSNDLDPSEDPNGDDDLEEPSEPVPAPPVDRESRAACERTLGGLSPVCSLL